MPQWKSKISLSDLFDLYEYGRVTFDQVRIETIKRLKNNTFADTREIKRIIKLLENVKTEKQFDYVINKLRNFGGENLRIYIAA